MQGKHVVVMDNAPYHSVVVDKPPTFNANKSIMQEWLVSHNIEFGEGLTKKQLWDLIKPFSADKINRKFVIDELLKQNGCEVLRIPPYHCQYNPIELAWGYCKTYYNKHIRSRPSSKDTVRALWQEALSSFTVDMWRNSVKHCEKLIKDDWARYMGAFTSVDDIPPVIISLAESESDTDFSLLSLSDNEDSGNEVSVNESVEREDTLMVNEEQGTSSGVCNMVYPSTIVVAMNEESRMSDVESEEEIVLMIVESE
ncbi:hypothetical protein TcasGA2_TC016143 [Tribolium castaneum]|uniref:Tc1-like transposase DDE domain-containing protein n=1 Tax=Tribolium castaneum TaxID=7070 RepID=D7GY12_TRICA|nr:hypothetical protein TcasGA2_TC016143 [Tribolium castaneum]